MNVESRFAKIDRRLDAIALLIRTGMKLVARNEEAIRALIDAQMRSEEMIRALAEAQKRSEAAQRRTDARLDRLIDALLKSKSDGRNRAR